MRLAASLSMEAYRQRTPELLLRLLLLLLQTMTHDSARAVR